VAGRLVALMERLDEEMVAKLLARACEDAGSHAAWARRYDICPTYAGRVMRGEMHPGKAITDALGLRRVVTYELVKFRRKS
jgi:hypothetical protein